MRKFRFNFSFWADRLIPLPDRRRFAWILGVNLVVTLLALTLGRPLGQIARRPFTLASIYEAFFSLEVGVTLVSFTLLLTAGVVLLRIYQLRLKEISTSGGVAGSAAVWWWMSLGFFFLAADEMLFLHEAYDKFFHLIFRIKETAWSDRLDDLIPLLYALVGLGVLYRHRGELRAFSRFWSLLGLGMGLMVVMAGLDALTNRKDILTDWLGPKTLVDLWWFRLTVLEEGLKLMAEGIFLGMFLRCHDSASQMASAATEYQPIRAAA